MDRLTLNENQNAHLKCILKLWEKTQNLNKRNKKHRNTLKRRLQNQN